MTERKFTQTEVSELLSKAARLEGSAGARGDGLTLAEIKEAARAAGMDPKWVDTALTVSESAREPKSYGGIVSSAHRDLVLPHPISEEQWGRIVAELRRTLGGKGTAETIGETRVWDSAPYRVMIENVDGRAIVTADADWVADTGGVVWSGGVAALGAVGFGILAMDDTNRGALILSGMMALLAAFCFVLAWGWYRKRPGRIGAKMDDALSQIERLSNAARGSSEAVSGRSPVEAPPTASAHEAGESQRRDLMDDFEGYSRGASAGADRSRERD